MGVAIPITDSSLAIGGVNGLLLVGENFDQIYDMLAFDGTTCDEQPLDFTGFTMSADVLDSSNTVLDSFTVTPSVGDALGQYRVQLTPAQVTTTLRDQGKRWRFRFTDGVNVTKSLMFNAFTVT